MNAISAIVELSLMGKLVLFIAFAVSVFVLCSTPWPLVNQSIKAGEDDEDCNLDHASVISKHFFSEGDSCPKCDFGVLHVEAIDPTHDGSLEGPTPWNNVSCTYCAFTTDQQLVN